jgi:hypothetical protein
MRARGCARLSAHISENPGYAQRQLSPFLACRHLAIVADVPPGPSVYDVKTAALADLDVVVLLADAGSPALLPHVRRGDFTGWNPSRKRARSGYVFNRIEPRRRLCRGVLALAREVPGETMLGTVHRDEAVANRAHDILALAA